MLKITRLFVFTLTLFSVLSVKISASDENIGSEYYDDFFEAIPQDIRQQLPSELWQEDGADIEAVSELAGFDYMAAAALGALADAAKGIFGSLSLQLGILIIASIFNLFRQSIRYEGVSKAVELACGLCVGLAIFSTMEAQLRAASETIGQMNAFMTAMLPIMGGLYAAGGNVSAAAASSAGLMVFVTVVENICCYALFPFLRICFGFSIVSVFYSDINLSEVSKLLKKTFTLVIAFLTTLLTGVLALQSSIANGVDSVAAKAAKFAVGSFVPIVGSALSDAVKTVAGSLSLIKNLVGVTAIVVLILMALPVVFSLLMGKLTLGVSGAVSGLLGCSRESRLVDDLKGIYNLGLAMIACTLTLFLVSLALFIKCAVALGI